MDLGIKGRVAVVTGAKSGMGRSTAEHLLREGVHVVLTDKEGPELQATAAELAALGQVRAVEADLSGAKGIEVLAAIANMAFDDKPTILVCAAGITGASETFSTSPTTTGWRHCRPTSCWGARDQGVHPTHAQGGLGPRRAFFLGGRGAALH